MTARQREVHAFIVAYWQRHGFAPTLEEIAAGVGLASKSTAWQHVQTLLRDGYLEQDAYRARTIRVGLRRVA